MGLYCSQLQLLFNVLSCVLASQHGFRSLRPLPFLNNWLRICYFVWQSLILRRELIWLGMVNIESLALKIKGVGTFFQNFVNFVLLSFLLTIKFFVEVVSSTLGPVQKSVCSLLFLLIFFLLSSPKIVVWMEYSLRQVQRNLLWYLFALALIFHWRFQW